MASKGNPDYKLRTKPKQEFNKIRRILLRNIPPSTEGEIAEFLGKFKAEKIEIRESLDSAVVTLKDGRQLEDAVTKLNNTKLKDNDVAVTVCASDKLVCVAHLPASYNDEHLRKLAEEYGTLKTCFLMRSEKTGHSKSYGLLEFEEQDIEKVRHMKDEMDWKDVGSTLIHVDFIEPSCQTWDRLQSRCLTVNGLPKEFTEITKLREIFSVVTSPVYCQIVMYEKESLGMGIVEYRKAEEAEDTWEKLQDVKIEDKEVTISFCIPSKSAVFINNRVMWKFAEKADKKGSLLPDPVSAKPVISKNAIVLSLMKQNPNLVEDFNKVLSELHNAYVNQMMCPGNKPGLLGAAPALPMSPMMNPHLQMGLIVMLALHIQAEKKEPFTGLLAKQLNSLNDAPSAPPPVEGGKKPSILGDPVAAKAYIVLANLKQQLNQVAVTEDQKKDITSTNPAIRTVMAKFMQNAQYLNLSLLINFGQMVVTMHSATPHAIPNPSSAPTPLMARPVAPGGSLLNPPGSGRGLLGDVPRPSNNPATMRFMKTLEAVASQKLGGQNQGFLSAIMTNINANPALNRLEKKTSLLGEPPQHLRQQKDAGSGGMGGQGGRGMGNMGKGMGGNMGMGGGMGNMGGGMGNNMGNMGGGMGNMGGNMGGGMGGNMGNMGGGMGNMGGGMGNMGGGMGNMGGGMGNMGGGMGNMGGGMGNMGGGMGNMSGNMSGMGNMDMSSMGGMDGMGGGMGGGMGMGDSMGQQGGNKQNWGSGMGQGGMGRSASGNAGNTTKSDSYSTFGNYNSGYGDMSGYGGGYTEEYSQFSQGDYNNSGYGDTSMYGGDQSGYQYSDYSGNYNSGQDSYNFQGSSTYSGNFGDYTGGYSGSTSGNSGFNFNQNQSGNMQDGGRFSGGGNNWTGQGSSSTSGSGLRNNSTMSKNLSGGGAGPGGGSSMGQGTGAGFGSASNGQSGFGTTGSSAGRGQGLLDPPKTSTGSFGMGGSGTGGMERSNMGSDSYQTSSNQSYMTGGNGNMASYGYSGTDMMEGYNTGSYDDGTGSYGGYGGDYNSYSQAGGYSNTGGMASYSTTGNTGAGLMSTPNQMASAGSKRNYGNMMSKSDQSTQEFSSSQQGMGSFYEKRPRLY